MFRYMETEIEFYKGKRILELGAGTGILGLGAAKIGMTLPLPFIHYTTH